MSHQTQLEKKKYRNWVQAGLGLKYVKEGLQSFCVDIVEQQHDDIINHIKQNKNLSTVSCGVCSLRDLEPDHVKVGNKQCPLGQVNCNCWYAGKTPCPNNVCGAIYDQIIKAHGSTPPSPYWKNTDIQKWCTDPWSVAKCFINVPGYYRKSSAAETDCAGLLHLIINNTEFHNHIRCQITGTDVFSMVRDYRNKIFHSDTMELENDDVEVYIDNMIAILQDDLELKNRADSQMAVNKLKEDNDVEVYIDNMIAILQDDLELKKRQDSQVAVKKLQELLKTDFVITTQNEEEICRTVLQAVKAKELEFEQKKKDLTEEIDLKRTEGIHDLDQKKMEITRKLYQEQIQYNDEIRQKIESFERQRKQTLQTAATKDDLSGLDTRVSALESGQMQHIVSKIKVHVQKELQKILSAQKKIPDIIESKLAKKPTRLSAIQWSQVSDADDSRHDQMNTYFSDKNFQTSAVAKNQDNNNHRGNEPKETEGLIRKPMEVENRDRGKTQTPKAGIRKSLEAPLTSRRSDDNAAKLFSHVIEKFAEEWILQNLTNKVTDELHGILPCVKAQVIIEICTDLLDKGRFDLFIQYFHAPKEFASLWITERANIHLFANKRYASLAVFLTEKVFITVLECLQNLKDDFTENSTTSMENWIDEFQKYLNKKYFSIQSESFQNVKKEVSQINNIDYLINEIYLNLRESEERVKNNFRKQNSGSVKWMDTNPINRIIKQIWGCPEQCPFCGEPCAKIADHDSVHYSIQHRPSCCMGVFLTGSKQAVLESCELKIQSVKMHTCGVFDYMCGEGTRESCKDKLHSYCDYKTYLADWDIPPSSIMDDVSKFWMWFVVEYKNELQDYYHFKINNIPPSWHAISKDEAKDSLQKLYCL